MRATPDARSGTACSHPIPRPRTASRKLEQQIKTEKLAATALGETRYAKTIHFESKPITEIAMDVDGSAGLAGGEKEKPKDPAPTRKKPKKKGGLLGKFTTASSEQKQSSQTVASAGARGGFPDRDAKGGANKSPVPTRSPPRSSTPSRRASPRSASTARTMSHFPAHVVMGAAALAATLAALRSRSTRLVRRQLRLSIFLLIAYVLLHLFLALAHPVMTLAVDSELLLDRTAGTCRGGHQPCRPRS